MAVAGRTAGSAGESRRDQGVRVIEEIRSRQLRWVELFYTDLLGGYNHLHMPSHTLEEDSFVGGIPKLDGSSVRGFREIFESDMVLLRDPTPLGFNPWGPA
jgi:glutamine synthetase